MSNNIVRFNYLATDALEENSEFVSDVVEDLLAHNDRSVIVCGDKNVISEASVAVFKAMADSCYSSADVDHATNQRGRILFCEELPDRSNPAWGRTHIYELA